MMSMLEILPVSLRGEVKYVRGKLEKVIKEKNFDTCSIYTSSDEWRRMFLIKEKRETFVHCKELSDGSVRCEVKIYDPKRSETVRFRM